MSEVPRAVPKEKQTEGARIKDGPSHQSLLLLAAATLLCLLPFSR
jgi:hypothetical protein